MIILLFFFYLDALVLLVGAEINSEIDAAKRMWHHEQGKPPPPETTIDTKPAGDAVNNSPHQSQPSQIEPMQIFERSIRSSAAARVGSVKTDGFLCWRPARWRRTSRSTVSSARAQAADNAFAVTPHSAACARTSSASNGSARSPARPR